MGNKVLKIQIYFHKALLISLKDFVLVLYQSPRILKIIYWFVNHKSGTTTLYDMQR